MRRQSSRGRLIGASAIVVVLAMIAGGYVMTRGPQQVTVRPVAPPALPPTSPPASSRLALMDEGQILSQRVNALTTVKFTLNPRIVVMDFPDLRSQGLAFNRMASFLEKAGLPRDRVLNDRELAEAVKADNATIETYYYGHDYRLDDVSRFFATARRQGLPLLPEEEAVRSVLEAEKLLGGETNAAVITVPREGSDPFVDASGRASLLRHELSHGEYFTNPAYAGFVRQFWAQVLSEGERRMFRDFLTKQGYDPSDEDLLINEMQAHLMNTTDERYFNPKESGLARPRVEELRARFVATMPAGWLKTTIAESLAKLP